MEKNTNDKALKGSKAKLIQKVERDLKKAVESLRKKNEANSKNLVEGGKTLTRSRTSERARFSHLPAKPAHSRDSDREKVNRSIDNSLLRNGGKSPGAGYRNANISQASVNKSLNLSVEEANKIDNSFSKQRDRTSSNSKKVTHTQRKAHKSEQDLLSAVYSVKKQVFLNISPIGKGKKTNDDFKELSKLSESKELVTVSTILDSTNTKPVPQFVLNSENISYSVTPFNPDQVENKIEYHINKNHTGANSTEFTRKSSLASNKEEFISAKENLNFEKLVETICKFYENKRLQFLRYSFSRLDLYLRQAKSKIRRLVHKRETLIQHQYFVLWKEVHLSEMTEQGPEKITPAFIKAIAHREWFLLNKYFYKGWVKFLQQTQLEKRKHTLDSAGKDVIKNKNQTTNPNAKVITSVKSFDVKSKYLTSTKATQSSKITEVTPKKALSTKHTPKETSAIKTKKYEANTLHSKAQIENKQITSNLNKSIEKQPLNDELLNTDLHRVSTPTPVVEFSNKNQLDQSFGIDTNPNTTNVETGIQNPFGISPTGENFKILNDQGDDFEDEQIDQIETRIPQPIKHDIIHNFGSGSKETLKNQKNIENSFNKEESGQNPANSKKPIKKTVPFKYKPQHSDDTSLARKQYIPGRKSLEDPKRNKSQTNLRSVGEKKAIVNEKVPKALSSSSKEENNEKVAAMDKEQKIYQLNLNKALNFHVRHVLVQLPPFAIC